MQKNVTQPVKILHIFFYLKAILWKYNFNIFNIK